MTRDTRQSAARRGYTHRWRKAARAFLRDNPLCRACEAEGQVTLANEVDHIEPHRGDYEKFWDTTNWQSLCKPHHDAKTRAETGWGGAKHGDHRPAWLPHPVCDVTLVSGPPGSGKTTHVHERAGPHDVVIDLDEIQAELTGLPLYHAQGSASLTRALAERNARLAGLSRTLAPKAWVILSAPSPHLRAWWAEKLGADVVLLDVPASECKRRIRGDERRPTGVAEQHVAAVDRWWMVERGHREVPIKRGASTTGQPTDPLHRWNRAS